MEKDKKTTNKQWEIAIRTARQFVTNYDKTRWKICEIALGVCNITYGGRRSPMEFTLKRFANEIEINYQTLHDWIRIKRLVYDKLPIKVRDKISGYKYTDLADVCEEVDEKSTPKQVYTKLKEVLSELPENKKFMMYYDKGLGAILYNAQRPINMMNVDSNIIQKIVDRLKLITSLFEKELELRKKYSKTDRLVKAKDKFTAAVEQANNI